jgi:DNA-directed RNA polymerase subunit RPC12/RpoP
MLEYRDYPPELKEYLDHFPQQISSDIKNYATDEIFKFSRYLFTRREGKRQYAYCTHCHTESTSESLKHNTHADCPNCGSKCIVKASGVGRKRLIDEAYFVYYEKSIINPNAMIAMGIYAVRDYRENYHCVETKYLTKGFYLFVPGRGLMIKRGGFYSAYDGKMYAGGFKTCSTVYSMFPQVQYNGWGGLRDIATGYSRDSIAKAVKGTQYQYSTWESYAGDDMVKFFDLYSKYPSVEYLTKLGLGELVEAKLIGNNTYGAINWRGKSLLKVLRLSKSDIKGLTSSQYKCDPLFLRLLQIAKKDRSDLSYAEIASIRKRFALSYLDLQILFKYTNLRKISLYVAKQFASENFDETNKRNISGQVPNNFPVILTTQLESNVRLYEKLGFKIMKEDYITGSKEKIYNWCMMRNTD